jgi:hypothetical protein
MMDSEDRNQRRMSEAVDGKVTFRLPDVPLLHSISSEIRLSDTVTNMRGFAHINVSRTIFYADYEIIQVWGRASKGDWTVKTLGHFYSLR